MASAFNKDLRRSITHSMGRFLAIAAIVALGCGFYAGLRMTGPDMRTNLDAFTDGTNLYDVRVVSTLGVDDEMVSSLQRIPGVQATQAVRTTDVMTKINGEQMVARISTFDVDAARASTVDDAGIVVTSSDDSFMNRPILASGTWPAADDECVISADRVSGTDVKLGDMVQVEYGTSNLDDVLVQREFKVVGFVHSSYYISSSSMGTTTLGSGSLQEFLYVPNGAFSEDYPDTEVFVKVAGTQEEASYSTEYDDTVAAVVSAIDLRKEDLAAARTDALKGDAQATLDEKRADYDKAKADADRQLADGKTKLDDAAATIADSQAQLDRSRAEYDDGIDQLNSAIDQYNQGVDQINAARSELEQKTAQLQASAQAMAALPAEQQAAAAVQAQQAQQQLQAAQAQIDAQQQQIDAAAQQIEATRAQLQDAAEQLTEGEKKLEDGRAELADNQARYDTESADALAELADAETKLADAQAEIDDVENCELYVLDRSKNPGAESYKSDAGRVDNIASVFPLIFFLVAALVALTTMTRMIDEDRVLIGTYKALGYSRARITGRYLLYAFAASATGAALGIAVLCQVLPFVICVAYTIIYNVPQAPLPLGMDPAIVGLSFVMGVGLTLIATWGAAAATLREQPAALMLPRAPKAGKRILLERIGPLWRHLSFSRKVTLRNLFRYKKRFFMTVIGIGGCTALLLTGLGLSNSINDIIDKHFGVVLRYNTVIAVPDEATCTQDMATVEDVLAESGYETAMAPSCMASGFVGSSTYDGNLNAMIVTPNDADEFAPLVLMRDRVTQQPVEWNGNSVILTEKVANTLGVGVGDTITLFDQDDIGNAVGAGYESRVTGVMENYVYNYVYIGADAYRDAFGREPVYDHLFAHIDATEDQRQSLADELRDMPQVETVAFNDETIDTYRKMLKSVDMIVVVLVISAAALAFIVLYNLTNINITERRREIASLKVLGFTRREVDMYLFREIALLTLIGAALGLVLGVFMESFVVVSAEVDQVMFGREIHALSFVWAYLITVGFAVIVMLFMRRKLDKIDMVESLKSIE